MPNAQWWRDFSAVVNAPVTVKHLAQAIDLLNHDLEYPEERALAHSYLTGFTRRWGNLSLDTLAALARRFTPASHGSALLGEAALLAQATPEEEDKRFTLATLVVIRRPESLPLLLPYLKSPRPQERWLAALGLVALRDERALPVIHQMLVEFVGPNPIGNIFQTWRHRLLRLLADWGDPRVVPPIRGGLIATVRAEEDEVPEPHGPEKEFVLGGERYAGQEAWEQFSNEQLFWVDEEHLFVYALGRLDAFGALEGVPTRRGIYSWQDSWVEDENGSYRLDSAVPQSHADTFRANIWRVHMCFGALETQFRGRVGTIDEFADAPELAEAVERLLAGKFGLDVVARRRAMDDYDQAGWVNWTRMKYAWDANRDREDNDEGGT